MRLSTPALPDALPRWLYLGSALLTGLAVLGKAPLVAGVVPVPAGLVYVLCAASCLVPLLYRKFLSVARYLAVPIVLAVWLVAVVVQSRLLSHFHSEGRGTDQGDCVSVGVGQLLHGSWPYDRALMWSHNPMSCGPGWLAAHVPSALIGYPATMAVLFTCAVAVVYRLHGSDVTAKFLVLLAITPGFWLSYANGNDFVTFGVIVVAVSALTVTDRPVHRWLAVAGAVVVSQFRLPFVLLPAAMRVRWQVPACLVSIGLYGVFAWWRPDAMFRDGPFHVLEKSADLAGVPGGRLVTVVLFVVVTVAIAMVALRFPARYSALVYITLALVPLAAAGLVAAIREQHGVIDVLGHWEGVSWLTAVVAVAAGLMGGTGDARCRSGIGTAVGDRRRTG
ncbi:hypothetical protein FR943_02465 [Mycobacterium sp. TNTM28]|uniref:DUF2029 domain-containing protein n=1 Tax=[Mycobacterium] fortunisiensis TaxID=2600579 RepID=A0ABS6KGM8_9MYCO|nr:hypothetical protein [[Mycobacterium] fortunisiensis]MBU9762717.1 hypothetical protein [[Mycobacterium] fortunisiensis]